MLQGSRKSLYLRTSFLISKAFPTVSPGVLQVFLTISSDAPQECLEEIHQKVEMRVYHELFRRYERKKFRNLFRDISRDLLFKKSLWMFKIWSISTRVPTSHVKFLQVFFMLFRISCPFMKFFNDIFGIFFSRI